MKNVYTLYHMCFIVSTRWYVHLFYSHLRGMYGMYMMYPILWQIRAFGHPLLVFGWWTWVMIQITTPKCNLSTNMNCHAFNRLFWRRNASNLFSIYKVLIIIPEFRSQSQYQKISCNVIYRYILCICIYIYKYRRQYLHHFKLPQFH